MYICTCQLVLSCKSPNFYSVTSRPSDFKCSSNILFGTDFMTTYMYMYNVWSCSIQKYTYTCMSWLHFDSPCTHHIQYNTMRMSVIHPNTHFPILYLPYPVFPPYPSPPPSPPSQCSQLTRYRSWTSRKLRRQRSCTVSRRRGH